MKASTYFTGRTGPRCAAVLLATALACAATAVARADDAAAAPRAGVRVVSGNSGVTLQVKGEDFLVRGMNWDYVPIGENYAYSLWTQPDAVIEAALAREMPLLKGMGVNVTRQYVGIPPRWVKYIYETYGVWTVVNHPLGRYGFTVGGVWHPVVDYSDATMRAAIKADVLAMVDSFKGTPGVLMWLLGNENNYGLAWNSNEIQALPKGEQDVARAKYLYSLFGDVIHAVKEHDGGTPVAMANGDLQYIDLIAEHCKELDVFGTNVYRGISARDLFQVVKDKLGKPVMFSEFGADAYNAKEMREDQATQAKYLLGQWREIYEQSAGKGRVGNAIGGFIFQWSDGWWKFGQESRLDIHDTNASWPNGGYPEDFVQGQNNMNEEWWGICAKGRPDSRGLFEEHPRAAYYALQKAFTLPAYAPATDTAAIRAHFVAIDPVVSELGARGDRAGMVSEALDRVKLTGLRMDLTTFNTGGRRLSTPGNATPAPSLPAFRGFDRMESFSATLQADPADNVSGSVTMNVLGNVAQNPIDEIFYEKRGRPINVVTPGGTTQLNGVERVKVYNASISWDDRLFTFDGFYRTGHFHWGYEGDFFGLYREANYGINIDTYNADAPLGFEIAGKRQWNGLKVAFGPQLWWGANPAVLVKYQRKVGRFDATGIFQADITSQSAINSSSAVPVPPTHKATLDLKTSRGPFLLDVGAIWSGANKKDNVFQIAEQRGDGSWRILQDSIRTADAFGGKAKLTYERGTVHWYGQGAIMGLVADGGPTSALTFTGWDLKDTGSGNQSNVLTGLAVNHGNFQFAPNVLWQKPIVGPIPGSVPSPGRPRNVLADPFAVRGNRETLAGEFLLCYDPTPATFMWAWDNDIREDARFAASLGYIVRDQKTTEDAAIGILSDGVTRFAFPGAPPARHLWELNARAVSRLSAEWRVVAHAYVGTNEPNGDSQRLVRRYGADARVGYGNTLVTAYAKANDWGPYDYHRDFNLTYPLQLMADVAHTLGTPQWWDRPQTKLGARVTWRSLDEHSPRFVPDAGTTLATSPRGNEWEIRTYVSLVK